METKKKKFNFNTNAAAEMIESGAGISGNGHDDITGAGYNNFVISLFIFYYYSTLFITHYFL